MHLHHPIVSWLTDDGDNFYFAIRYFKALLIEAKYRNFNLDFERLEENHLRLIRSLDTVFKDHNFTNSPTFFNYTVRKSLSIDYRYIEEPITAYRTFYSYRWKNTDKKPPKWTNREAPEWFINEVYNG